MYCQSCGTALRPEMSYCNRCGANLNTAKGGGASQPLKMSGDSIVGAIVVITIAMLGLMLGAMALMKDLGFSRGIIISVMAMIFLMLLGIDGVFIWQLLRLNSRAKEARGVSQLERLDTKELSARREPSLPEPRTSVTEHTTRIFEPTYEERTE